MSITTPTTNLPVIRKIYTKAISHKATVSLWINRSGTIDRTKTVFTLADDDKDCEVLSVQLNEERFLMLKTKGAKKESVKYLSNDFLLQKDFSVAIVLLN